MSNEKELATKLHDKLCPKCNGRCHTLSLCCFTHKPEESDWDNNPANRYFLGLAKKAAKIMDETNITEDKFITYVSSGFPGDIPENVLTLMQKYDFL